MDSDRRPPSLQLILILGSLLCLLVTGYSLLRYPAILIPLRTGILFASVFFLVLLIYGLITWRLSFSTTTEAVWLARNSLGWGILISIFWFVEIVTGNLSDTGKTTAQFLYFGATGCALIMSFIAGIWGAKQTGSVRSGTLLGLYGGMISGLFTFLILMGVTYLFLPTFLQDPQNVFQFQESGTTDLTAFVIGDSLAGGIGHLIIGLVLGLLLGVIGGVVGNILPHGKPNVRS